MLLQRLDNYSNEALTPEGLCNLIQYEYQRNIQLSCDAIESYLTQHPDIENMNPSVAELLQILFRKLQDELKHVFLKESGIVFPHIKKSYQGTEALQHMPLLDEKVFTAIKNTQTVIIGLMQRIRQVLHHYAVEPGWSADWKECLNEFFELENKVLQWVHVDQNLLYPKVINGHKHHLN
ncbi:MAG: hypothetical protein KGO81_13815 [Bacteroidota bacterium]|nr:hypothetical protein [Bacteroidota bacterium]